MNLLFHLLFFRCALQHLDFRDVDGSFAGVYMGFHLHVVAFMAFERLWIFDIPRLLIFVGDKLILSPSTLTVPSMLLSGA
jgi:hypothetical protein